MPPMKSPDKNPTWLLEEVKRGLKFMAGRAELFETEIGGNLPSNIDKRAHDLRLKPVLLDAGSSQ